MAGWSAANVGAGQDMAGSSVHGTPEGELASLTIAMAMEGVSVLQLWQPSWS